LGPRWYKTYRRYKTSFNLIPDSNEPDWIVEQAKARKRREMLREREEMETRLAKIRAKEKAQKIKYLKGDQDFKRRKTEKADDQDGEEQFILDDYDSDGEQPKDSGSFYSAATLELMAKMGMGPSASKPVEEEAEDETKVCYRRS
jgi:chromosome transmission fidelity protein 1